MPRFALFMLLILMILPAAPVLSGCAKRSEPPDPAAGNDASADGDALLEVAGNDDTTPIAPPSMRGPVSFQGPPLKPTRLAGEPYGGESIAPPAAVPDASSSSSSSDDAVPQELVEAEPSVPEYISPTLQIDPARLFRRREDWSEGETAADALGRIGAPATAEVLAMLEDPSPAVRRRGAEILAHIGSDAEEAIEPLIQALEKDPDPAVRKAAAYALGQMGPKAAAAVPALTRMLRESQ